MSSSLIDLSDRNLHWTALVIVLCPLIWNVLARLCHRLIPKQTPMSQRYFICYLLMIWIFCFSSYRDYLVRQTILRQPKSLPITNDSLLFTSLSIVFFLLGQVFVLSSFYKLGLTGTFLGDYCGILMDAPVRTFPFNVLNNPMYVGSSLSFLGIALFYRSPIGLLLTLEIYFVYRIALLFEEPYTAWIYRQKNK